MTAIIFDMDDTLVATAPLWRAAEIYLLESLGAVPTEELALQCKGMNALDVAATIYRVPHSLPQPGWAHWVRRIANFGTSFWHAIGTPVIFFHYLSEEE